MLFHKLKINETKERMTEALNFWNMAYQNGWFVRLSIVDKTIARVIGTIEICLRVSEDDFDYMGRMSRWFQPGIIQIIHHPGQCGPLESCSPLLQLNPSEITL